MAAASRGRAVALLAVVFVVGSTVTVILNRPASQSRPVTRSDLPAAAPAGCRSQRASVRPVVLAPGRRTRQAAIHRELALLRDFHAFANRLQNATVPPVTQEFPAAEQ